MFRKLLPVSVDFLRVTPKFSFTPHRTMALSNFNKTLKTPFVGAFQMIADPLVTEQYGALGFGAVLIDQQHGLLDERTAFEAVSRLEKFPACFPIIRVCDNTTALISRALDAGAPGILAPMINNAEEAKRLVDQCRYPPEGLRSWGPTRAMVLHPLLQPEEANQRVRVFAMIETAEAIRNIDSILNVPGLDGIFVGPSDLSISLGVTPKHDLTQPEMVAATSKVLAGCKARNKVAMLMTPTEELARQKLAEGWDGVFPGADISWMINAARPFANILQ